jgi:hypothetical protein
VSSSICIVEEGAEDLEWRQRTRSGDLIAPEVVEVELVNALLRGSVVGVYLESVEVADDQERRIAEVFPVVVELLIGSLQIFVLLASALFVLPSEVITPPYISEPITAVNLGNGFFEGESLADSVRGGWVRLAEHRAQIYEVRLRSATLG